MKTEFVTIMHGNEGIRIALPSGTRTFPNAVQLAESYAIAMAQRENARKLLVEDASKHLNEASGGNIDDETRSSELTALRNVLLEALRLLS